MLKLLLLVPLLLWAGLAGAADEGLWSRGTAAGEPQLQLYFFWSQQCPHCNRARPFVQELAAALPWLELHDLELTASEANRARYRQLATLVGEEARSVPAFIFCGQMLVGFEHANTTGRSLRRELVRCRERARRGEPLVVPPEESQHLLLALPGMREINLSQMSLPLMTVVIATLDAFNPCAFFVLLFLLSLLVHAGGRGRMLLIGGVFVFVSGLVYFGLMAAWLNLFLLFGQLRLVTALAGVVAVGLALLNLKDFFRPNRGPSLSMGADARSRLGRRIRGLLRADNLPTLLAGTVMLAVAANSYELLCTSGLPMVYTRLLTLEALPGAAYYLYLIFYNLIYVLPLLVIVLLFVFTLGSRKLQPEEGRLLKLLSGCMMLGLGGVLVLAPQWLSDLRVALGLVLGALLITIAVYLKQRRAQSGH